MSDLINRFATDLIGRMADLKRDNYNRLSENKAADKQILEIEETLNKLNLTWEFIDKDTPYERIVLKCAI